MSPSLRAFLNGIIDYAGLFPPASLSMKEAVSRYAAHRESPEAFMLGRFVCPAARLGEFETEAKTALEKSATPWSLTALGHGAADSEGFVKGVWTDLARVSAFTERARRKVTVDSMELALPPTAGAGSHDIERLVEGAVELFASHRHGPRFVFFEIPSLASGSKVERAAALRALAECRGHEPPVRVGAKIRTGGTEAAAFPAPEALAGFVVAARDRSVPWKATAGLHHPLPRYAPEVGAEMHGFLNLFGCAVLGHRGWLDARTLLSMLHESDAARFSFDENGLAWGQHRASTSEIEAARATVALSFGSCSFEEPVDDLKALGLLDS